MGRRRDMDREVPGQEQTESKTKRDIENVCTRVSTGPGTCKDRRLSVGVQLSGDSYTGSVEDGPGRPVEEGLRFKSCRRPSLPSIP